MPGGDKRGRERANEEQYLHPRTFKVAYGPFYGFVTADPAEVVMNAGLLVYAMRKELMLYVNRKAENNEATS